VSTSPDLLASGHPGATRSTTPQSHRAPVRVASIVFGATHPQQSAQPCVTGPVGHLQLLHSTILYHSSSTTNPAQIHYPAWPKSWSSPLCFDPICSGPMVPPSPYVSVSTTTARLPRSGPLTPSPSLRTPWPQPSPPFRLPLPPPMSEPLAPSQTPPRVPPQQLLAPPPSRPSSIHPLAELRTGRPSLTHTWAELYTGRRNTTSSRHPIRLSGAAGGTLVHASSGTPASATALLMSWFRE
jgi:hypothetical protein